MKHRIRHLSHCAMIAALYAVAAHLQNLILPGSGTWAVQFRGAEALCVLAFFTPAAVPGLTLGCLLFNILFAQVLPPDLLVGSAATLLSTAFMWKSRSLTVKNYPLMGMLMPGLWNGLLVGWELSLYMGGGFFLNALAVAAGESLVMFTLGTGLFYALRLRKLDKRLFG